MFDKPIGHLLKVITFLYVCFLIGNISTGIINKSIDNAISNLDGIAASLLSYLRFLVNFEGAIIIMIVGILFWLLKTTEKLR